MTNTFTQVQIKHIVWKQSMYKLLGKVYEGSICIHTGDGEEV